MIVDYVKASTQDLGDGIVDVYYFETFAIRSDGLVDDIHQLSTCRRVTGGKQCYIDAPSNEFFD